jgi:hypothetical protein
MPFTATSMMDSGVSLQVARWSTCDTPFIASSTTLRCSIEPLTTSSRGVASSFRWWQSARTVHDSNLGSFRKCSMKAWPTLPVAPVTSRRWVLCMARILAFTAERVERF